MGKMTGFMDYRRQNDPVRPPETRIADFGPFRGQLDDAARQNQGGRCMDCGVPLCQSAMVLKGKTVGCPLHNIIPEWNDEIWNGNLKMALARLLKTNPFPEFTGRVCPALCEKTCICGLYDTPVTIRENELYIIESAFAAGMIRPRAVARRSGKRVAVVGSGPAGLACADRLNMRGHEVTVFEKEPQIGGLLMYGIPNMKLPKDLILRRRMLMEAEGVEFRTSCRVGKDVEAGALTSGFDAVVVAAGAEQPREIRVPGVDDVTSIPGIRYAVDFLRDASNAVLDQGLGKDAKRPDEDQALLKTVKNKHVVIVGGGDTAVDCVATCVRLGCASVAQYIRRPEPPLRRPVNNPWPEYPATKETGYGQEEAAAKFGKDPREYETVVAGVRTNDSGHLTALTKMKADRSESGKITPRPGTEKEVPCDLLLLATGFSGVSEAVADAFGLDRKPGRCIDASREDTPEGLYAAPSDPKTNGERNVFVCGDARRGASLVVWAISEGRECARAVDIFLMGYSNL